MMRVVGSAFLAGTLVACPWLARAHRPSTNRTLGVNITVINQGGQSHNQQEDLGGAQPPGVNINVIKEGGTSQSQPEDRGGAQPPGVNIKVINLAGNSMSQPQDVGFREELPPCAVAAQPLSEPDDSDRMNSVYFFLSDISATSDISGSSGVKCLQRLVASPPILDSTDLELRGPWRECLEAAVRYEHLVDWDNDARFAKCSRNGEEHEPNGPAGQVIDLFTELVEGALLALEDSMHAKERAGADHPKKLLQATTRFRAAATYLKQLQVREARAGSVSIGLGSQGAPNEAALDQFQKASTNGYYSETAGSVPNDACKEYKGEMSFEECAQECKNFGSDCEGFEVYQQHPEGGCFIFIQPKLLLQASCVWNSNELFEHWEKKASTPPAHAPKITERRLPDGVEYVEESGATTACRLGYVRISALASCSQYALETSRYFFGREENQNMPKGCYRNLDNNHVVYNAQTGIAQSSAGIVCVKSTCAGIYSCPAGYVAQIGNSGSTTLTLEACCQAKNAVVVPPATPDITVKELSYQVAHGLLVDEATPQYEHVQTGVAGPGEKWDVDSAHGLGVASCFRAVMADSECFRDFLTYVTRGDKSCGCTKRSGRLAVRADSNGDIYRVVAVSGFVRGEYGATACPPGTFVINSVQSCSAYGEASGSGFHGTCPGAGTWCIDRPPHCWEDENGKTYYSGNTGGPAYYHARPICSQEALSADGTKNEKESMQSHQLGYQKEAAGSCGGSANGAPCVFPFVFHGTTHTSCTTAEHDQPWCATDYLPGSSDESDNWGNCNCNVEDALSADGTEQVKESVQSKEIGLKYEAAGTCGGSANGAPCLFPFIFHGTTHTSCTTAEHDQPWCATDYLPGSSDESNNWGNCNCDVEEADTPDGEKLTESMQSKEIGYQNEAAVTCGGLANGAPCVFPFIFHGTTYTSCTSTEHDQPWCATDYFPGSVEQGNWGNCNCDVEVKQLAPGVPMSPKLVMRGQSSFPGITHPSLEDRLSEEPGKPLREGINNTLARFFAELPRDMTLTQDKSPKLIATVE